MDDPSQNRFCDQRGAPLDTVCPSCGGTVRSEARFCGTCGKRLREAVVAERHFSLRLVRDDGLRPREFPESSLRRVLIHPENPCDLVGLEEGGDFCALLEGLSDTNSLECA